MRLVVLLTFLLLLAAGAAAQAAMLGDSSVSYSADRTLTIGERTYNGKLYARPGSQRHEQSLEGIQQIMILQGDSARGWLLLPVLNAYIEFGIGPIEAELQDDTLLSTRVGEEVIDGRRTNKYRIEHTAKNGTFVEGYLWLTREGIPMRLDGSYTGSNGGNPTKVHMQLSHVEVGPQDSALFVTPRNMMKLPYGELSRMLGFGKTG